MIDQSLYQKFPIQLTRWLKREKLESCLAPFRQYGEKENEYYIIKSDRKKLHPKYAIFIRRENKLQRETDTRLLKEMSFADLALVALPRKQNGVSLLKTMMSVLI